MISKKQKKINHIHNLCSMGKAGSMNVEKILAFSSRVTTLDLKSDSKVLSNYFIIIMKKQHLT